MRRVTYARLTPSPSEFQHLAASNLLAHVAERIGTATLLIVAVTSLHAGAGSTGAIQMLATLPFLLFAIPFGTLADRRSPRTVMIAGEVVLIAALSMLILLMGSGGLTIAVLALLGLAGSTGTVAYTVGAPSMVQEMTARERLLDANRTIELTRSLAFAAGPALAGALIGWVGASSALTGAPPPR